MRALLSLCMLQFVATIASAQATKPKAYNLPPVSLKSQILWDSTCDGANGFALAFGGQDQRADQPPRTRINVAGEWSPISDDLAKKNPLGPQYEAARKIALDHRLLSAKMRYRHFQGLDVDANSKTLDQQSADLSDRFRGLLADASIEPRKAIAAAFKDADHPGLERALPRQAIFEALADALDAEPSPRCLSPLVFDAATGLFVLFGGDHLDYLTNDLWVFDPAKKQWQRRFPESSPAPRANHRWRSTGDGKLTLVGGYTYTSSTSYCGAQYRDLDDGEWTYDLRTNAWTGPQPRPGSFDRTYRSGPFVPSFFVASSDAKDTAPDRDATALVHKNLPANRWVEMKAPKRPELCRTWGHAVLDPDGGRILVFSGGHSAHGGSDVLHYHLATNRWELPVPVEFPLGQLYSNTEYPDGFNLNRRPWVTGHTYHSYNYDPLSKKMYFVGQRNDTYVYDPVAGDWTGRFPRPKGMLYGDAFYTLNLVPSPHGLLCWTQSGQVFRLDPGGPKWEPIALQGDKLPGSVVDNSTHVYDSKRDRLVVFRGIYGKPYDGIVHTVDVKTGQVKRVDPAGAKTLAGANFKEADHAVYLPDADLVLFGQFLGGDGDRRALAYDCDGDRWVSLEIGYEMGKNKRPSIPYGPGHSCGLMWDAARGLVWGVDTHDLRVYALRLDRKSLDLKALE